MRFYEINILCLQKKKIFPETSKAAFSITIPIKPEISRLNFNRICVGAMYGELTWHLDDKTKKRGSSER